MGSAHRLPPVENHAESVIRAALRELGLTEDYLRFRLGFEESSPRCWSADLLGVFEWLEICRVLCLDIDSISYGYDRRWHVAKIRAGIETRTIDLPRTPQLRAMLRELRTLAWSNWRFESRHYGFRLRWRIRRRRFIAYLMGIPRRAVHLMWWKWKGWEYRWLRRPKCPRSFTVMRSDPHR
jgi:hypothetical protein